MEEGSQQSSNSQKFSADPRLAHQKVLQPDASFVAEMKASQQSAPDQVQPASQDASQVSPQTPPPNNQPRQHVAPASAIYPEPTAEIGIQSAPSSAAKANEPKTTGVQQTSKILAVRVVAAVLVLVNAINAYNWYIERRAGYTSWINLIGIGIGVALAVGIFFLVETARSIYVVLSLLILVLTCISLVSFYISVSHSSSAITNATLSKSQLQKSITNTENNPTLTAAQKQAILATLQRQLNSAPTTPGTSSINIQQYFSSGLLLVTSVFPLVFLTRPAIKQVFK